MRELIIEMANRNIGSLCLFLKNKNNKEYMDFINMSISPLILDYDLSEKIYYFVNRINHVLLCNCGGKLSFIGFKNGYRKTCGKKECFVKQRKITNLEKLGVDNPKKSKDIIEKEKLRIKEKWGEHYMLNKDVKYKFNKTMLEKWGVEWAQQSDEIKNKSKKRFKENPNKEEIIKRRVISFKKNYSSKIEEKKKNTIIKNWGSIESYYKYLNECIREKSIKKYGVEHHLKSNEVVSKRIATYRNNITNKIISSLPNNISYVERYDNTNFTDMIIELRCNDCKSNFKINRQYLWHRIDNNKNICLLCNPILHGKSNMELDVLNFIKENYKGEILSNKKAINNLELDIFLPEISIGIEFNGLYWHSDEFKDKNYHYNKYKICSQNNIDLVSIWEDDWIFKKEIVQSIILNKIGRNKKIIGARKCEVKEVNNNLCRRFLNENHLQGFVGSAVKIGLFYHDELVSLMTFGNLRKTMNQVSKDGTYELLRFCSKLNTTVSGGASKLLSYFLNNFKVDEIITYSKNDISNGNLYKKLGFEFQHETSPGYYWIINDVRQNRFNWRKDKLVKLGYDENMTEIEIMKSIGYNRIFDCGNKKWVYRLPNQ